MNIGIDFDGVLFDTESIYRALSQIYNLKIKGNMIQPEKIRFQERFDWSIQQNQCFINSVIIDVQKVGLVMPLAKQIIKALSKNHNVYAITGRGVTLPEEIEVTEQRLKEENIEFKKVVYSASDKLGYCKDLKIDLMIDDLYSTVINLANNGIKCLYYRDNINDNYNHPNITVVRDWGDIAVELVNMGLINIEDIKV